MQCQHTYLHRRRCARSKHKSPGMAWICRLASKTMSTHMNLHCSGCNRSKNKQTSWHGMEMLYCFQNNVNTHENLHHSRCNRSKHTSPCVPSHLKIASKIASTNHLHGIAIENCFENSVNTHEPALWCNHSKNKQITWHGMDM